MKGRAPSLPALCAPRDVLCRGVVQVVSVVAVLGALDEGREVGAVVVRKVALLLAALAVAVGEEASVCVGRCGGCGAGWGCQRSMVNQLGAARVGMAMMGSWSDSSGWSHPALPAEAALPSGAALWG
eukprot:170730-Chlamydomonas_euryale.AAC.1